MTGSTQARTGPIQESPQGQTQIDTNGASSHLEKGVSHHEHVHPIPPANQTLEDRLRNPFANIPLPDLLSQTSSFATGYSLSSHTFLLQKAALLVQNGPDNFPRDDIPPSLALTNDDRAILAKEACHPWRSLPPRLILTVIVCSIGAALQGWDQTGSNGATIFFPSVYGIESSSVRDRLLVGLVNAAPYIGSALLGCWLADPMANLTVRGRGLGRRGVIFVSGNLCLWPVLGSAFCQSWGQQLGCRLVMGVGMGLKGATVPVWAAENVPARVRGALVMTWQLWTAFGIFLGTAFNLAVFHVPEINWRLMLGAPLLPAIPLLALLYLCPESPRWLMKHSLYAEAFSSLLHLRPSPLLAARDLILIHAQLDLESSLVPTHQTYLQRLTDLFTIPRIRFATLASTTVMLAQQLSGINIIAFYSTTLFLQAGHTPFKALLASLGFGAINLLFALPALKTIDSFGRRALLLATFPHTTWSLLGAGLSAALIAPDKPERMILVALFVYLFAAFYAPGCGPVPFVYSAEVFPLSHREVGMGFAVAVCLAGAAILAITFPFLLEKAGVGGAFGVYAGLNVVAGVMVWLGVPETKRRTLEELDGVFEGGVGGFVKGRVSRLVRFGRG